MQSIVVKTEKSDEVLDITDNINDLISDLGLDSGMCFLSVMHTTAALSTADLDPGTDLDMLEAFYKMVPSLNYRHPHDPEHVPDHILSTMIGTSINLPVHDGKLVLGRWQRVVMFEFNGPKERRVTCNFVTE